MPVYSDAFPIFIPCMRIISSITQANPMVITTTLPHQYGDGLIVRLLVPFSYGMTQANDLTGQIVVLNSTQFSMPIDSTLFNAFSVPSGVIEINAQVVPFGENAHILTQAEHNRLPY